MEIDRKGKSGKSDFFNGIAYCVAYCIAYSFRLESLGSCSRISAVHLEQSEHNFQLRFCCTFKS